MTQTDLKINRTEINTDSHWKRDPTYGKARAKTTNEKAGVNTKDLDKLSYWLSLSV